MLENRGAYQHMIFVIQNKQWDEYKPTMQAFLELVQAEPASVVDLAHMVLEHAPEGGTYFDTALSFLPMEDWPTVVEYALEALRRNMTNQAAQSILQYANLQCPEALHASGEEQTHLASEFCKVNLYLPAFDDPPTHYSAPALHFAFPASYLTELLELRSQWPENRCHPTWVQSSKYPSCPVCRETQQFLLQLDDDLLTVDDQTGGISNWMWSGDSGMAYLFWCDACKVSSVRTQCV